MFWEKVFGDWNVPCMASVVRLRFSFVGIHVEEMSFLALI